MKSFKEINWNEQRFRGDEQADQVIESVQKNNDWKIFREIITVKWGDNQELPENLPTYIQAFFEESSQLPVGTDKEKIARGQRFFQTHAEDAMSLLGTMSLPFCYAAADGAQVLYFSERMRNDAQKRLLETARFVFEVNQKDSLTENGIAFTTILKVRLLHATIRFHLKSHQDWNKKWGLPINQEDLMGTNISFSLLVVRGLRKLGKKFESQEVEDYMYLWYVVGQLLGIDKAILPKTIKEATLLAQSIENRLFEPSLAGKELMAVLLRHFDEILPPFVPKGYIHSYMRYLLGDKTCDLLDVPKANWTQHLVSGMSLVNTLKASFDKSPSPIRSYWEARQLIASQR